MRLRVAVGVVIVAASTLLVLLIIVFVVVLFFIVAIATSSLATTAGGGCCASATFELPVDDVGNLASQGLRSAEVRWNNVLGHSGLDQGCLAGAVADWQESYNFSGFFIDDFFENVPKSSSDGGRVDDDVHPDRVGEHLFENFRVDFGELDDFGAHQSPRARSSDVDDEECFVNARRTVPRNPCALCLQRLEGLDA